MESGTYRPLFLFDGACGFCRKWAAWLQRRVGSAVQFAPFQEFDDLARFDLTVDELRRASYLIEGGRSYDGGRGFARTLARGRGISKVIGLMLDAPVIRLVTVIAYRGIAANRHRLPAPSRDLED